MAEVLSSIARGVRWGLTTSPVMLEACNAPHNFALYFNSRVDTFNEIYVYKELGFPHLSHVAVPDSGIDALGIITTLGMLGINIGLEIRRQRINSSGS